MAALAAALGTVAGEPGYLAAADLDGDGQVDAADSHLLVREPRFLAQPGAGRSARGSGFTHVDLETAIRVASFLTDPEGDRLTFRIVSALHGTARLSGDGSEVLFTPDARLRRPRLLRGRRRRRILAVRRRRRSR